MENNQVRFVHVRHATSIIEIGGKKILIDPMLSAKDSLPSIPFAHNRLKNPGTELPFSVDRIVENIDYLLLTHLHFDHFDQKAAEVLSKKTAVLCSRVDVKRLNGLGFSSTFPIENEREIDGIKITQYPATHGVGLLKPLMGKGSSYLLDYKGVKIFLTGDCLLTPALKTNLLATKPDVVIANAGAAQFKFGKPITMSITDVQEISKMLPDSRIVVVHLDVINHCDEKRDYCKTQIQGYSNIYLPNDGEEILMN